MVSFHFVRELQPRLDILILSFIRVYFISS